MTPTLFSTKAVYPSDFDAAWHLLQRAKGAPKSASKKDALKAYFQVRESRPHHALLLLCIEEYLADIAKRKQFQLHSATFFRQAIWEGYLADAQWRLDHPPEKITPRPAFRASDFPDPISKPTRTAAEILASRNPQKGA